MGDIFWVAKISNIFLGCLKFLIFFGRRMVDAGPEPTYAEKMRLPPPPPPPPPGELSGLRNNNHDQV